MLNVILILGLVFFAAPPIGFAATLSSALKIKIDQECAGGWAAFRAATMSGMPQTTKDIAQPWLDYCGTIRSGQGYPDSTTDATPGQITAAKTALGEAAAAAGVYLPKTR